MNDERMGLPSASTMERIALCPGSHLADKLPRGASPSADRGTKIHKVLEGTLPASALNRSDFIVASRIMHYEALLCDRYDMEQRKLEIREKRYFVCDEELNLAYSACPDVIFVNEKGDCLFINYKAGWMDCAPVKNNYQLLAEAVAVFCNIKVKSMVGALIKPNAPTVPYETKAFSKPELIEGKRKLLEISKAAMQPRAPRRYDEKACFFCDAKKICKEYEKNNSNGRANKEVPKPD